MTDYTPGPWFQNPADAEQIMSDGDAQVIARVPSAKTGLYNRQAPANARLIAAAPDLLAELIILRRRFHAALQFGDSDPEFVEGSTPSADAAIAKALGRPL